MPQPTSFSPRPTPPTSRHWWRWIIISLITVLILGFIGQVGYYMWQFRYGDASDIARIQAQFSTTEYSGAKTGDGPQPIKDLTPYIRSHNPTLGSPNAPVKIIAFIDFECPFCKRSQPIFNTMLEKYGPAVQVIYKALPLTSIHPNAFIAAEAAACAHDQGKFWEYYEHLFTANAVDAANLTNKALALKLDQAQFLTCQESHRHQTKIEADINDAITLGVRGTPTYFVNNAVIEGVADAARWDEVILSQLR